MVPGLIGELIAEFFGTFIVILFGVGVVAQVVAGEIGGHDSIAWSWGLGVTMGIYVAARISGAHLNPAVSIALAVFSGFSWKKVAPYVLAQTAGAFVAALLVRWNYTEVIAKVDPGHTIKTQGIFSTLPGNGTLPVSDLGGLRDQIIGTMILVFVIFALTDLRNSSPLANLAPVVIGLLVVAIGMAWAPTPATRSIPLATSGRGWPHSSPDTAERSATSTAICTSGFPSSVPSSAASSVAPFTST
jgi:glycerol uptake facilitator protein